MKSRQIFWLRVRACDSTLSLSLDMDRQNSRSLLIQSHASTPYQSARQSSFLNLLLNHFLYLNFVDYRYFKSDVTISRNSIFHKVSRAYHPRRKCLSAKDHVQQGEKIQIEHKKLKSVSGVINIVVCNMVHKKRDN